VATTEERGVRITRIEFKDFRGFHEETLELGEQDTVVFAGPNGSGKSSVLAALGSLLASVTMLLAGQLSAQFLAGEVKNVRTDQPRGVWGIWLSNQTELAQIRLLAGDSAGLQRRGVDDFGFVSELSKLLMQTPSEPADLPVFTYLHSSSTRNIPRLPAKNEHLTGRLAAFVGAFDQEAAHFEDFEAWFEAEENIENELIARHSNPDNQRLPALFAVREAVRRALSTLNNERLGELRVKRTRMGGPFGKVEGRLTIEKDGSPLYLDQLSDGERRLILLVGDVARRMAILNPHLDDPTSSPGVLLADEIDLHLHPGWQRRVMPALRAAFPGVQLIVTTHSPQVLASVPSEAVVMMRDFKFLPGHPKTFGRDTNTLLDTVFDVPERPEAIMEKLTRLYDLLDDHTAEARALYEELERP
jgi:predicted ATP-binding protein involved in virulence